MGIIKDLARQGKDKAVAKAMAAIGENAVSRYGTLQDVRLDSLARTIEMDMLLKGEDIPVHLTLIGYEFISEGGRSFVIFKDITVSREWMEILAQDLFPEKKIEIPSKYSRVLDALT